MYLYVSTCIYIHLPSNFLYMNSRKSIREYCCFYVNHIDSNDTSGNKGSTVFC